MPLTEVSEADATRITTAAQALLEVLMTLADSPADAGNILGLTHLMIWKTYGTHTDLQSTEAMLKIYCEGFVGNMLMNESAGRAN